MNRGGRSEHGLSREAAPPAGDSTPETRAEAPAEQERAPSPCGRMPGATSLLPALEGDLGMPSAAASPRRFLRTKRWRGGQSNEVGRGGGGGIGRDRRGRCCRRRRPRTPGARRGRRRRRGRVGATSGRQRLRHVRPRRPGSAGLSPRVGGGSLHWAQVPHTKETNQAASGVRKAERGASARLTAERGHRASVFGLELARPAPLALCGHGMRLGLETGLRRGLSWVSTLLAANLGTFWPP